MMNNFTTVQLADTLQMAIEQGNNKLAVVALNNLQRRGIEVDQIVIDLVYPSTTLLSAEERLALRVKQGQPTMKELRKNKGLAGKIRRATSKVSAYIHDFDMDAFLTDNPIVFKVVDFFFDAYEEVEVDVDEEDDEQQDSSGNVVKIDFNNKK